MEAQAWPDLDDALVALNPQPLDVAAAVAVVTEPRAGGIAVFVGTTRAERRLDGAALDALDYEAYADMAGAQMRDLARRARERWPVLRVALLHRTGRVALGEPSVVVAVSTPHRAEAFEACRFAIDAVKATAPIWKKETWAGGEAWGRAS